MLRDDINRYVPETPRINVIDTQAPFYRQHDPEQLREQIKIEKFMQEKQKIFHENFPKKNAEKNRFKNTKKR